MADLDPSSLNKLRVTDLREHLSNRGLSTSGLKADLVKRLKEALLNEDQTEISKDEDKEENEVEDEEKLRIKQEKADEEERIRNLEEVQRAKILKAEEVKKRMEELEKQEIAVAAEARKKAEEKRLEELEQQRITDERRKSEEEKTRLAELERQKAARDEEKRKMEDLERQRIAEQEERRRAEAEERRRAEVEERRRFEELERERIFAEQEKKKVEEKRRLEELERQRIAVEQERKRAEEEEIKRLEELERQRMAAEQERKRAEEEEIRRLEELERQRIAAEQEKKRAEEEERRRLEELEKQRIAVERKKAEEERRRLEEIEQQRIAAEQERRRLEELEKQRIAAEQERRRVEEEERKRRDEFERLKLIAEKERKKAEENQRRRMEELQKQRVAAELERKRAEEAERRKIEELEKQRLAAEQEQRIREEKALVEEEERQRAEDEMRLAEEERRQEIDQKMDTTDSIPSEIKLPHALEKVLALKTERAQLLGVDPDSVVQPASVTEDKGASTKSVVPLVSVDEDEYVEDEDLLNKKKESKSRRRKKKKKKKYHTRVQERNETNRRSDSTSKETSVDIDIEYVQEVIDNSDPLYSQFMKIFEKFKLTESEKEKDDASANAAKDATKEEIINPMALRKKPVDLDDDEDEKDDDEKKEEEKPKLSKRKLKKLSRMSVAELKQKVNRPELVEMHDVTAKDPVLLLHLKASRNTVPVPRHWCFKRKYLQGKRGIEKPAFELPDFIKRTGIMEMRQALQEKEDQKTMKAKMRERVRPKLGKIDIDYQKLHDAFFKWQTKPRMTIHGDLYYEGKEFETRLKEKKPGDLSEDLRTALGMPTGPNANKCPPPWLIAMQRYGPPPSYPNLKIPGLNAPIPEGCSFGYHAGGWGKPPVDESGRPLYGDVFGTQIADNQPHIQEEEIDHTLWGELESESSEEEEDEDEEQEEEEEEKAEDETGLVTPAEGLITPSGFSSIPAGMETPDMIELRKRKIEAEMEGGETPALYTILPEKKTERVGAAMMGSTHIYDLAAAIPASKLKMGGTTSVPPQGIEVALDPSELEMDTAAMAARYEQTMREQQSQLEKEDLSDMVAEHAARQKNKRKKQQMDSAKPPKKYKEFKF